jgi:DnaK suppressor protein
MAAKTPKKPAGKSARPVQKASSKSTKPQKQKKPQTRATKSVAAKAKEKAAVASTTKRPAARSGAAVKQRPAPRTTAAVAAKKKAPATSARVPVRSSTGASQGAIARAPSETRTQTNKRSDTRPMPAKKPRPVVAPIAASTGDSPFKNFTPYEPAKGEEYMNAEQLDHFRTILLRWRQELMEEVDRTMHHMQDEAANFPDPADRASQEEEFSIELRTRDRERKLIKKIDQTIDRIDQEDYGFCDTCGVEIGLRRLEARPTASQCVDCKTLDEIKERQQLG